MTFGALFLPTALGIASGQDCVLMLAVVMAVYVLADCRNNFASGAVLGLGMIKFHLFLLWPVAMLLQKRWRMLAGASVTIAGELLLSLILAGPGGLMSYYELLQKKDIEHLNPSPELMINVHSLALNFGADNWIARALLIAVVIVLVAIACWRTPLWRWIAAASTGSLLVPPHVYGYDAGLLLAPIWFIIFVSTDKWIRIAATLACTPIPYLMTLAGMPWAATTPMVLLSLLAILALRNFPKRTPQNPAFSGTPSAHKAGSLPD